MTESVAAFEDLELDTSDMMTNPTAFSKRVYDKAEELKNNLKEDTSINALVRQFEDTKEPVDKSQLDLMNALYTGADKFPIEQMPSLIEDLKQLVKDLETAFQDRVIREAATRSKPMQDKRLSHALYITMRERFNGYVEFMNAFFKTKLEPLPPLPGNYGRQKTGLKHYVFEYNGEQYRNPRALCRKIGIEPISFYDRMLEYLNAHPELDVEVKEVM